jgi:hypothetical protein
VEPEGRDDAVETVGIQKLIKPKDHAEMSQRATELKRMLTAEC